MKRIKMTDTIKEVSVYDMALSRENRALEQSLLLKKYNLPLISFTLNIAGPIKTNTLIKKGFAMGIEAIKTTLKQYKIPIVYYSQNLLFTGSEAFVVFNGDVTFVKEKMLEIESIHPIGILFDIDVIDKNGDKIERHLLNGKERKCIICNKNAKECARNRTHTATELYSKTIELLENAIQKYNKETICSYAIQSVLYEITATPKPGLVDRNNSGSHSDMDIFTFMASAGTLYPYFLECYEIGVNTRGDDAHCTLDSLRDVGKRAELFMYRATDGINTHKGAIFTLGIVLGAVGRLYSNNQIITVDDVFEEIKQMCKHLIESDYKGIKQKNMFTKGEMLYNEYKICGVRGEAESGFSTVKNIALPILKKCFENKKSINDALCITLLYIIKSIDDTVLISRSSLQRANEVKKGIDNLLKENPYPSTELIEKLDTEFIKENLSVGGAADLLSVCYFIYLLENKLSSEHDILGDENV